MRSEVNAGMSFPILRPCGDRSALAVSSSAAWLHPEWGVLLSWAYIWGQGWSLQAESPEKFPQASLQRKRAGAGGKVAGPHPCLEWVRSLLPGDLAWGSTTGSGNQCVLPSLWCLCWFFWGGCGKFVSSFLFLHIVRSEELSHPQTFHKRTVFNQ